MGINDAGEIVGYGVNQSGYTDAFLLTPINDHAVITTQPPPSVLNAQQFGITVSVQDAAGHTDPTYSGNVTLYVATGSSTLSGTTTVQAENGIATFNDLALNGLGEVTLIASADNQDPSAVSDSIFVEQPLPASYSITDLGVLSEMNASGATAINDSGEVVGWSAFGLLNDSHAFLYSDSLQSIGTLGGSYNYPTGINDNGQVVGWSQTANGNQNAFLYSNGTATDLGTLFPFGSSSAAGINDSGQIVGGASVYGGYSHAFIYSDGTMQDIGTLPGYAYGFAVGINNSGEVAGWAETTNGSAHAFLYANGTMHDLGALPGGGTGAFATAINDSGQVVGYSTSTHEISPWLYTNGSMQELGTLAGYAEGYATAINDNGQIVGYAADANDVGYEAFLYSDGHLQDLNDDIDPASGWRLAQATGINNVGQIVGYGYNPAGQLHAFLLTPLPTALPSEPQVTNVVVGSTHWSGDFLSSIGNGDGTGYAIPAGPAQLADIPWSNLNQIQIQFNENVNVQENSLTVTGLNVAQYAFSSFSYSSVTHIATWSLAQSIGADKVVLDLQSTGPNAVTNAIGDGLDGKWTNGTSVYPSGDGTTSDFDFAFNVLPGDLNQDGTVNSQDLAIVSANWLSSQTTGDNNGDGIVNSQDLALISSNWLVSLPASGMSSSLITGNATPAATTASSSEVIGRDATEPPSIADAVIEGPNLSPVNGSLPPMQMSPLVDASTLRSAGQAISHRIETTETNSRSIASAEGASPFTAAAEIPPSSSVVGGVDSQSSPIPLLSSGTLPAVISTGDSRTPLSSTPPQQGRLGQTDIGVQTFDHIASFIGGEMKTPDPLLIDHVMAQLVTRDGLDSIRSTLHPALTIEPQGDVSSYSLVGSRPDAGVIARSCG